MLLWCEGIRWTLAVSVCMTHMRVKQPVPDAQSVTISPGLHPQQCESPSQYVFHQTISNIPFHFSENVTHSKQTGQKLKFVHVEEMLR